MTKINIHDNYRNNNFPGLVQLEYAFGIRKGWFGYSQVPLIDVTDDGYKDLIFQSDPPYTGNSATITQNSANLVVSPYLSDWKEYDLIDTIESPNTTIGSPFMNVGADFNGDGRIDMVSASSHIADPTYSYGGIIIYINTGKGTFVPKNISRGGFIHGHSIGDLDDDGDVDIIYHALGNKNITCAYNDGKANFTNKSCLRTPIDTRYGHTQNVWGFRIADYDNDGFTDVLLIANHGSQRTAIEAGQKRNNQLKNPGIFWGNGSGKFSWNDMTFIDLSEWNDNAFDRGEVYFTSGGANKTTVDIGKDGDVDLLLNLLAKWNIGSAVVLVENLGNRQFKTKEITRTRFLKEDPKRFRTIQDKHTNNRNNSKNFTFTPLVEGIEWNQTCNPRFIDLNNDKINEFEKQIKLETDKVTPLRSKNIENLSKIQRLNLELQNLDEENNRIQDEIKAIKESLQTLDEDINREKGIIIDANSNEKRLKEEKSDLIEVDSKYFETEKLSNEELENAKNKLNDEQKLIDKVVNSIAEGPLNISLGPIQNVKNTINRAKELIESNEINQATTLLDRCNIELDNFLKNIKDDKSRNELLGISKKSKNIKSLQEKYADAYSKNESIKKESVKRNERIKTIGTEIESWKNLLSNSEKMVIELDERKNKLNSQLELLENQPRTQAEKKGQISENLRISDKEKNNNEIIINETDEKIEHLRTELNNAQEESIQIRERKASSGATIEGLNKRKSDLLDRVSSELDLTEENILENSNLNGVEDLPNHVDQEDLLDKKKQVREKLGSVNLKADEETNKYEVEIKKMEQDRADLVTAIAKLKESINELNQKGRDRLVEAFEKVNRKFNEVYTKLFNGGNAKLELVDSDDPLEAGLEMLVSPPGKRLQSITLLSGGEQALTALSLIFAVFLTNPSPICVLDEVDAPLDDANVTRFCSLLEDLTKITNTKFIIVTHHALTMSKMNRLYGVTMPEKGISQLVAVDLQKAESMVA